MAKKKGEPVKIVSEPKVKSYDLTKLCQMSQSTDNDIIELLKTIIDSEVAIKTPNADNIDLAVIYLASNNEDFTNWVSDNYEEVVYDTGSYLSKAAIKQIYDYEKLKSEGTSNNYFVITPEKVQQVRDLISIHVYQYKYWFEMRLKQVANEEQFQA